MKPNPQKVLPTVLPQMGRWSALIFSVSLLAKLVAQPVVTWQIPVAVAKEDADRDQDIRLAWINDEEVVVLRRGGVVGRYHCGKKEKVWERRFKRIKGFTVASAAVYLVRDEDSGRRALVELDATDGWSKQTWTESELASQMKAKSLAMGSIEWLPKPGMLVLEVIGNKSSSAWFFDPARNAFRGSVPLGGYLWSAQSAGKRLVWMVDGVILWAAAGDHGPALVWDSGLGEGGDDYPGILACQVGEDGGFAAVLDNGGWTSGARLFLREGLQGEVRQVTIARDLQQVAVDYKSKRIWSTDSDSPWFGLLDFSGKIVTAAESLKIGNCWAMEVAPSGTRAAVVNDKGVLSIIDVPPPLAGFPFEVPGPPGVPTTH